MLQNIFHTNTTVEDKKRFSKRILILLFISTLLTGVFSIPGLFYILFGTLIQLWELIGVSVFFHQALYYSITFCCFLALIKIIVTEIPFSKTLVLCIRTIGILLSIAAFIAPRLPDYAGSNFEFFHFGNFTLMDGSLLLPGFLLLILSELLSEGLRMQKELDEIL